MAVKMLLTLFVLSLVLLPGNGPNEPDEATHQHVREHEEMLSSETTWLLQEWEQESQSSSAWGVLPFAASQQGHIWAISAVLELLFGLCWWLQKRSSRKKVDTEKQEEKPGIALDVDSILCTCSLIQPQLMTLVQNVMTKLLCKCQEQSNKCFFPVPQTPIAMRCDSDGSDPPGYHYIYRLLVPLTAPRGHSFHLELGTMGEKPSEGFKIRVGLDCTCEKEQPDKDMLCFLHHPEEELGRNQPPSLLDTHCTSSYLDLVKIACWFQGLVKSAWVFLPESKDCHLTMLPSSRSCRLQLTSAYGIALLVEMQFAVEENDSDTIRIIK